MKLLTKLFNNSNFIDEVALYWSEQIKSTLRTEQRFTQLMHHLMNELNSEFKTEITSQQLILIIKETRIHLYKVGIAIHVDEVGVVAGRPYRGE